MMALAILSVSSCSASRTAQSSGIQTVNLDMKVFQTLTKHSALARTRGDGHYIYIGDVVKIISESSIMYDDLIFKGKFVLVDTYTYTTTNDKVKTVPVYMPYPEYKVLVNSGRPVSYVIEGLNY